MKCSVRFWRSHSQKAKFDFTQTAKINAQHPAFFMPSTFFLSMHATQKLQLFSIPSPAHGYHIYVTCPVTHKLILLCHLTDTRHSKTLSSTFLSLPHMLFSDIFINTAEMLIIIQTSLKLQLEYILLGCNKRDNWQYLWHISLENNN